MQTGEAVRLGQDVYTLQGQIGRGSFGIVRKALNQKTKAHIALKRSAISDSQAVQELQHEVRISLLLFSTHLFMPLALVRNPPSCSSARLS